MQQWTHPLPDGRTVQVVATDATDGDFFVGEPAPSGLESRRRRIMDAPWTWLRQVHGNTIVEVDTAGEHAGAKADGALTTTSLAPIAVTTADCAPVVLVGTAGVAVLHAGWRGAASGIIGRGAEMLARHGGAPVATFLGACISPGSYEFGAAELDDLVARFGPEVEGRTTAGARALDMPGFIASLLQQAQCPPPQGEAAACTSDQRFFSHRTRGDLGRQTTVAWIEPAVTA